MTKNHFKSFCDLWDNIKLSNIQVIGASEVEELSGKEKKFCKYRMTKKFLNLMKKSTDISKNLYKPQQA